jgi:hypothetical protein
VPDIPFAIQGASLSLLAGVLIFLFRIVAKGTWMHRDTHLEIVAGLKAVADGLKAVIEEERQEKVYWRSATMATHGITDRALAVAETKANGNGPTT